MDAEAMIPIFPKISEGGRLASSGWAPGAFVLAACAALAAFVRFFLVQPPFSFDYVAYIKIIQGITELSYSEIIGYDFNFPYISIGGLFVVEFGFAILVKTVSLIGFGAETLYAVIAAASLGLRVYVMRSLGVPLPWLILVNVIAITLFEANALRLGIATSILLLSLLKIYNSRTLSGFLIAGIAHTFHMQIVFFFAPFIIFYVIFKRFNVSRLGFIATLVLTIMLSVLAVDALPLINNAKIQEYVDRGGSASAGLTLTSFLAALLILSTAVAIKKRNSVSEGGGFFANIIVASVPSIILLLFATDIAVVGDRAWQVAYLVYTTFFFLVGLGQSEKRVPLLILSILTMTMLSNVLIRYPLSNFFSPPMPEINFSEN